MSDLRDALAEIKHIRSQVARDTQFRGYGPASIAASGLLGLMVAWAESQWTTSGQDFGTFAIIWILTALVSVTLVAVETTRRARRVHAGFANEMLRAALEQFIPALVTGVLLTVVFARAMPHDVWMLPGLWELLFGLGVFASCRFLPRLTFVVGVWYLISGLVCLVVQSESRSLAPWTMGVPFGIGQLLVAVIFHYGSGSLVEEA